MERRIAFAGVIVRGTIRRWTTNCEKYWTRLRRDNAAASSETRRYFEILAEDLRHQLRLVAEGVSLLTERFERRDRRMLQPRGCRSPSDTKEAASPEALSAMKDELWRRIEEIAGRGRRDSPLSPEE